MREVVVAMPESDLPIMEIEGRLRDAVARTGRILVRAPTGSGKSTRIPRMLLGFPQTAGGQIVVLQPRRLAARMLAARVAAEIRSPLGELAGYQIRMDSVSSERTKILFVTEGILLRRMLRDPELSGVAAVLLDEFHERHLHGDIGLARCMDLQEGRRPDLKLLVLSATLDSDGLLRVMGEGTELIESAGRTHPVATEFLARDPADEPVWDLAARTVAREFPATPGSALVFMPGAYEIQRTVQNIRAILGGAVPVLPLHGEMPVAEQDRAVAPSDDRRVIVATNVAETSLTIAGISLVVDSGLARIARYDARRGINTLLIEKISRAAAAQRAGRAGRTMAGRCIRLWTQRDHERRPAGEQPEIRRLDLADAVLTLKACGVGDLAAFRWIDPPEPAALRRALDLLADLGALDGAAQITATGRQMLEFPVHPRYARMFIEAGRLGCVRAACLLAALVQGRSLLTRTDRRTAELRDDLLGGSNSDFGRLFRAFYFAKRNNFRSGECRRLGVHAEAARQAAGIFGQFCDIAERVGLEVSTQPAGDEAIGKCLLAGFSDQVGRRRNAGTQIFDLVHGRTAVLPRDSLAADARLVVAAEITEIGGSAGEARIQLGLASAVESDWLAEIFPQDFSNSREAAFDSGQRRVVMRTQTLFRDLVLEFSDRDAEPGPLAAACLAARVQAGELRLNGWDERVEQLIARINFLAGEMPELGIRNIGLQDRELILAQLCEGAVCYRDIKDRPALDAVRAWLAPGQGSLLDRCAPGRIELPGGRSAKIVYGAPGGPRLSARIQDLFGLEKSPAVADGRVPVTLEILAPNHRPVQVTRDLAGFWTETYPALKPALQRRYPKHRWA